VVAVWHANRLEPVAAQVRVKALRLTHHWHADRLSVQQREGTVLRHPSVERLVPCGFEIDGVEQEENLFADPLFVDDLVDLAVGLVTHPAIDRGHRGGAGEVKRMHLALVELLNALRKLRLQAEAVM
jgi:hypothetical protein